MWWPLIELPPQAERLHRLNLSGSPSLVEPRCERTVQPQEGVPALPRDRLHPVRFLARGSLWSEINVHRTIRIDQQSLGQTTDSRGLLIGLEHRACLVIVERERPPRTCRQSLACTRPSPASLNTSATARSACWPGSISSPAKFMPWSRTATAAASSSTFSSWSTPPIRRTPRSA